MPTPPQSADESAGRQARAALEAAREAVAEADAQQRDAVLQALSTGMVAVREVAAVLGVTRARVYQIRDGPRRPLGRNNG